MLNAEGSMPSPPAGKGGNFATLDAPGSGGSLREVGAADKAPAVAPAATALLTRGTSPSAQPPPAPAPLSSTLPLMAARHQCAPFLATEVAPQHSVHCPPSAVRLVEESPALGG